MKKKWIATVLVMGGCVAAMLSMTACGSSSTTAETDITIETETTTEANEEIEETDVVVEEEEVEEDTGGPSEEILSASILDNKIQIGDEVGVNGEMSVSVLFDYGCEIIPFSQEDPVSEDYLVYGEESSSCTVYSVNESTGRDIRIAQITYVNTSESSISLKDCVFKVDTVFYDADETSDVEIYFAGGSGIDSTISDVTEALGEPTLQDEDDFLEYKYYAMDNEKVIALYVSFDRNTSSVSQIKINEDDYDSDYVASIVQCFPYYIPAYNADGEMGLHLDPEFILADAEALKDEIHPYFVQYYNEELTQEEYLAAILPILTKYGFYEGLANNMEYIAACLGFNELYDFNGSWSELLELVFKGDLSDETYETIFGPLESMDPR